MYASMHNSNASYNYSIFNFIVNIDLETGNGKLKNLMNYCIDHANRLQQLQ